MTAARLLAALAGLLGAAGVAAAAGSSHAGGALLGPLALIALTHAPALLALALYRPAHRDMLTAALVLALGALTFCSDLAARHFLGAPLFSFAAPLGGMLMIAGWLAIGLFGVLRTHP
ncbi:DUF423 domain-containing protein [Pelagibacterium xiamenense]|uniref:DUF423 domain-containing protein n=1 Tax=Pelagibacterium xiamenense TaxID=2901140 RepID=UPI001E349705|nr:DUF423 domain-containing protein [Pelagibacterium xiamenense]MCD7060311.1 DUF423 domain-containing protein [Pelagibacterium xiamenense]